MASKMFENLSAIVQNTLTDSIRMIGIDELHESEDNFFIVDRIEEFADTILGQGGVKDNLIVRPLETGGYEIISGHRRRAAVQHLLDRGENISRYLPCLVQNYSDEATKLIDIVLMNVSTRQISDAEMWQSYELLDRILKEKHSSGEHFGRVREKLAELLGVSAAQVGKMENVAHNAIPEIVEAVQSGEILISTANEIAKMDKSEQGQIVERGVSNVSHKEIKQQNAATKRAKAESDKSQNDAAERATYSTLPEATEPEDDTEERATYSTLPEATEPEDDAAERATCSTMQETTEQEDDVAERATYSTKPETTEPEDDAEERATYSTKPENTETDKLNHFIHEHYYDLENVFTSYISLTDDEDEIALLEEFQVLLKNAKEAQRSKIRLGM